MGAAAFPCRAASSRYRGCCLGTCAHQSGRWDSAVRELQPEAHGSALQYVIQAHLSSPVLPHSPPKVVRVKWQRWGRGLCRGSGGVACCAS